MVFFIFYFRTQVASPNVPKITRATVGAHVHNVARSFPANVTNVFATKVTFCSRTTFPAKAKTTPQPRWSSSAPETSWDPSTCTAERSGLSCPAWRTRSRSTSITPKKKTSSSGPTSWTTRFIEELWSEERCPTSVRSSRTDWRRPKVWPSIGSEAICTGLRAIWTRSKFPDWTEVWGELSFPEKCRRREQSLLIRRRLFSFGRIGKTDHRGTIDIQVTFESIINIKS